MKKTAILLMAMICVLFSACGQGTPSPTPAPAESTQPTVTATPAPAESPEPSPTQQQLLNCADTSSVYSDPDAFKGSTYSNLFQITGAAQQTQGKAYYARGITTDTFINTYTLLDFKSAAPELLPEDIVYVQGVIQGKGMASEDSGDMPLLLLDANMIETAAELADITSVSKDHTFSEGQCAASQDTLRIEINSAQFTEEGLTLNTNISDGAMKEAVTYTFEIIVHQDRFFSSFRQDLIITQGQIKQDTITLPVVFDSGKDFSVDFIAYDENAKMLYRPLTISVNLDAS